VRIADLEVVEGLRTEVVRSALLMMVVVVVITDVIRMEERERDENGNRGSIFNKILGSLVLLRYV
jgi:hypothetical protein